MKRNINKKILNKKMLITLFVIVLSILLIFLMNSTVNALDGWWWEDDTEEVVTFLQTHSEWLQFGSFFSVILHEIGWLLIKGLYIIVSLIEGLTPEAFNLFNFLDYAGVQGITRAIIDDLVVALMVLTFVYLGFKMVIAKEPPKFKDIGVNIFISVFLIMGMPTLMNTMQDISIKFYNDNQMNTNNDQVVSLSWTLIQNNTADLVYAAQQGFDIIANNSKDTIKNSLTPDIFKSISLSELITPDAIKKVEFESNELKYLKYNLSTDGQGNLTATEIDSSFLSFFSDNFDSGYFRYPSKFFIIITGLLALGIAYIFNLFVIATTIIEIGIKRIVGLFVFATDLEGGQRTKMVVQDILNAFMLIAFTGLSLNLFTMFLTFLGTADLNIIVYLVAIVSATFILIKGSNTIMRYFGVDVGLKDGFAQIAGAFAIGKTMSDLSKKPFSKSRSKDKGEIERDIPSRGEGENKSINNTGSDKLNKSVNTAGKTIGYMKERGFKGMTEDAVKGTGEKIIQKGRKIADGAKDIKNNFEDGIENGVAVGQSNKEKWNGKERAVRETSLNGTDTKDTNNSSINDLDRKNNHTDEKNPSINATDTHKQRLEGGNTITPENETRHITEDIKENKSPSDIKTKLNQEQDIKSKDLEANIKFKANNDNVRSINQEQVNSSPLKQEIKQEVKPGQINSSSLRQEVKQEINPGQQGNAATRQIVTQDVQQGVIIGQDSVQRIKQQVDRTNYGNMEQVKQSVIQEVKKEAVGNSDIKQRVVQEIEKSSFATPQQVQQNVQQVLQSARVPQVNEVVQKVIQEQSGTKNTLDLKAKVIQELQETSFGSKEPIKQTIIQDVEKGFSATPEQLKENIKQVIQTTETQNIVEEKINNKKSGYFGSLFGDSLDEYDQDKKEKTKNKSRFDFIKNL